MTIEDATNVTIEDAIKTFELLVFSQDFSPSALRAKAINELVLAALRTQLQENKPLTLEELREMDEPVWVACKPIEGGNGYWCLCQHGHIITPAGSIYNVKEIPHWVFYRRPPEGEDET